MDEYLRLLKTAMGGQARFDERTGAGTVGVFQQQGRWDLTEGFPIVTTKPTYFEGVAQELLWFLRGQTNITPLLENNVRIWTSDCLRHNLDFVVDSGLISKEEVAQAQHEAKNEANYAPARELMSRFEARLLEDEDFASVAGELGPVYGAQWRGVNGATATDQVLNLENQLRNSPGSRYQIVDAWNPVDKPKQALPACHMLFQTHVSGKTNQLTLGWYQRSCDTVLGVPFNIASYGLLAHLLAETHGLELGELVGTFADLHVYLPHLPAAEQQLERKPFTLPHLKINKKRDSVTEYERDDFELVGYKHHPKLDHPTPMFGGFF